MWEISQRLATNSVRMIASQFRDVEFTVEPLKLGLLEGEQTSPGSAVAYLILMNLPFAG